MEKYSCVRCLVYQSYVAAAESIAIIVNRWVSGQDTTKMRDIRMNKVRHKQSTACYVIEYINIDKINIYKYMYI